MNTRQNDQALGARRERRLRMGRGVMVVVLGVLGMGVVALQRVSSDEGAEDSVEVVEEALRVLVVETVRVGVTDQYEVRDRFVGRAEAARSSRLGFELAGTVEAVAVDDGVWVEAGQVLAHLDTARLEARRAELVATLEQLEATRDLARSTLERTREAVEKGAVSRQELDEASERWHTGEAMVRRTGAQIEVIDVDLAKSVLVAPYEGTIAAREVDEGTIVAAGTPVLHLLETGRLEVRVGLSAEAASGVRVGERYEVRVRDGDLVSAVVERVMPQRDARVRTVDVVMVLEDCEERGVRDGDLVEMSVGRAVDERGVWLPRTALTESARGLWAAYVAEPEAGGRFALERRQLEVIDEAGERVYVRGALGDGERVVASGLHRLVPGQRVEVVSEAWDVAVISLEASSHPGPWSAIGGPFQTGFAGDDRAVALSISQGKRESETVKRF